MEWIAEEGIKQKARSGKEEGSETYQEFTSVIFMKNDAACPYSLCASSVHSSSNTSYTSRPEYNTTRYHQKQRVQVVTGHRHEQKMRKREH